MWKNLLLALLHKEKIYKKANQVNRGCTRTWNFHECSPDKPRSTTKRDESAEFKIWPKIVNDYGKIVYNKNPPTSLKEEHFAKQRIIRKETTGPILLLPEFCLISGFSDEIRSYYLVMKYFNRLLNIGIRTIAPEENCLLFMVRVWVSFTVGEG